MYITRTMVQEKGGKPPFCVVVCAPEEPDENITAMLCSPFLQNRVRYIKGTVMNESDLYRIAADTAVACFVVCDLDTPEDSMERVDAYTALRAMVIKNFNPKCKMFVQLLTPSCKFAVENSGAEVVLCVQELQACLMAQSCLAPGSSTMLENLFQSFGSTVREKDTGSMHDADGDGRDDRDAGAGESG